MAREMSNASLTETEFVECGLCYENDELKRLPCSPIHILCVTCLTRDSAETKIIQCPFCKQVSEGGIDALPSANSPLDEIRCCDVCRRKDEKYKLAQHYCMDCKKRFCKSHHEGHNFSLDDHTMILMSEYLKEYRKMETRYCSVHSDQVYSLACKKCYGVYCPFCSPWESQCNDGGSHQMIALDKFVEDLISAIAEKKIWIFDKEETILGIVKELTRVISDWGTDTEEMIQLIHQARNKQIEEITAKYEALEKRLTEMRRNAMTEVSLYLDGDIGTKLNKLTREIRRLDTRVFTNHKVDVINGYKETERLCDELMQMKVPVYKPSENHVTVSITDTDEDYLINACITQWTNCLVTSQSIPLPTSLKLQRKVKVSNYPDSVVHRQEFTYVGVRNRTVERIVNGAQVAEKFMRLSHDPNGLVIHNDHLYVLGHLDGHPQSIQLHDLTGTQVSEWSHGSGNETHLNKMCIVNENIVVCNKTKKCITIYGLTGNLIKEISCESISNGTVCMATAPNNTVIVTDSKSARVFRVDIKTGKVMWTSKHITMPQGVTCYGSQYVFVANCSTGCSIWILHIQTGQYLGKMNGASNGEHCSDNLIVPSLHEHMIHYYQII